MSDEALRQAALAYHAMPRPGKIGTHVFKPAESSRDLALAYSPGVAEPVLAIAADPEAAYEYTNKGNLIGIVTDGSAILGLGNLGALASKPVMEGKALLFKRFADLDCVDIEINAETAESFIDTVARIADSFGGINIEDVGAPQCFAIEEALRARCKVPVFHDDQHGTAICVVAGLLNALELQGKRLNKAKIVCLGSGAAGTAAIVDHDRLAQSHGQPFAQRARQNIRGATSGEGHKNTDRPIGKGGRLGKRGGGKPGGKDAKAGTAGHGGHGRLSC